MLLLTTATFFLTFQQTVFRREERDNKPTCCMRANCSCSDNTTLKLSCSLSHCYKKTNELYVRMTFSVIYYFFLRRLVREGNNERLSTSFSIHFSLRIITRFSGAFPLFCVTPLSLYLRTFFRFFFICPFSFLFFLCFPAFLLCFRVLSHWHHLFLRSFALFSCSFVTFLSSRALWSCKVSFITALSEVAFTKANDFTSLSVAGRLLTLPFPSRT